MAGGPPGEWFVRELQIALPNLYNPAAPRKSRLLPLLVPDPRRDPVSALQQIFMDSIRALKPASEVPPQSNAWRIFHVLTHRYVEQSSQTTVASNLGLSVRQLRRQERMAEQTLADYMWAHYMLESQVAQLAPALSRTEEPSAPLAADAPGRDRELEWLRESFPTETADMASLLRTALKVVTPLAQTSDVQIECDVPDNLPLLTGQLATVRQALLNLLTAAVHAAPGGRVWVIATTNAQGISVSLSVTDGGVPASVSAQVAEALEMAREFAGLFGGTLQTTADRSKGAFLKATLALPVSPPISVLVVDDNADTLRLIQRYLSGTRYRFAGARDAEQALALAEESPPQIIVLDVMLPGSDDWELLGRLCEHPKTRRAPIIICTILPQEQLGLALGAAGFVRKPVSRQTLLSALDHQLDLLSKESR